MDLTDLQIAVIEAQKNLTTANYNLSQAQQDNKIIELTEKKNSVLASPSG